MLEKYDLTQSMAGKDYKHEMDALEVRLAHLQRTAKRMGIAVVIVFEGWGASGKGTMINHLISPLDPRGFKVFTIKKASEEEIMRPFLWRFWTKTPAKGRIAIFDRSWYRRVLLERVDRLNNPNKLQTDFDEINDFEKQLTDDDVVLIKLFLHISEVEQKRRFEMLEASGQTSWRVTKEDWKHHRQYNEYLKATNDILEHTNPSNAEWTVVEATDERFAAVKILRTVIQILEHQIAHSARRVSSPPSKIIAAPHVTSAILDGLDLSLDISKAEYSAKLKEYQAYLRDAHNKLYLERVPLIVVFEGWDASGKGGCIKRLTRYLDPRGYEVVPTPAPNDVEKSHHYLWRFWTTIPKAGHITIYDRSWYGRVMVEKIEGFCTMEECARAYDEINQFERTLTSSGALLIKFWMHIDKEEQYRRFERRQTDPDKQWKLTEEDWRNREKWDQYKLAVDEMLSRTSCANAPWVAVEANSKKYARIKVLETIVNMLREAL